MSFVAFNRFFMISLHKGGEEGRNSIRSVVYLCLPFLARAPYKFMLKLELFLVRGAKIKFAVQSY